MELGLGGKTVVITGGTAGIGKACAEAFLKEGCGVAVCGRSKNKLASFRAEFAGEPVLALRANTARPADMESLAAETHARFGRIDIWINNAGVYPRGYLMDMPLDQWRRLFAVNLDGVLFGCRAAVPYLRNQGGVILNAGSFATLMPAAGTGGYAISKAAVHHMTRVLAGELAPYGIRVLSYLPGVTDTDLAKNLIAENNADRLYRPVAQRRYASPGEIANVVVFLASAAASFMTGTAVEASGGKYCVQNPWQPWQKMG